MAAAEDQTGVGYQCEMYQNVTLRNATDSWAPTAVYNSVIVTNFPAHFKEKELRSLFESSLLLSSSSKMMRTADLIQCKAVVGCVITSSKSRQNKENIFTPVDPTSAEITFADEKLTK